MKSLSACIAAFVSLNLFTTLAHASVAECAAYIPAGVVIRIFPDEKLSAGGSSGPTIFTVSSDLRFFPNRPPLLARGTKIMGVIAESKEAGRFHGKARLRITLTSILTSDFCEYPIDARVTEAGRYKVEDDVIWGRGHARRDAAALLFPPTTMYQLLRTPSRGPKLALDHETPLSIKLLEPVSLAETQSRLGKDDLAGALHARIDQLEGAVPAMKVPLAKPDSRRQQ
jgi:hypothetical protein